MQIRSLGDAQAWLECTFRGGDGKPNHVALREGIVLFASRNNDYFPIPGVVTRVYALYRWHIVNDKGTELATGFVSESIDDWKDRAEHLWRACAAWGPAAPSPPVEYEVFTTIMDDRKGSTEVSSLLDKARPPHFREGAAWELVSTNVVMTSHHAPRIYYHWRRPVAR